MAADALAAYQADTAAGKDALLICDTTEMADALNQRIHDERLDARRADRHRRARAPDRRRRPHPHPPQRPHHRALRSPTGHAGQLDSVRNGNRWRVAAIDPAANRVAAERLDDGARAVFDDDYLREHITSGYAVTVHSAQGVTADTTHAVLGENTTRSLLYVAMTRGRHTNTAYLYERTIGDSEYGHHETDGTHVTSRGTSRDAADIVRAILANHDPTQSPHMTTPHKRPAQRCPTASDRFSTVEQQLHAVDEQPMGPGAPKQQTHAQSMSRARERAASRDRSPDAGSSSNPSAEAGPNPARLTSSSRTTPPAGLAMRTALETFEVPRHSVDSVGDA